VTSSAAVSSTRRLHDCSVQPARHGSLVRVWHHQDDLPSGSTQTAAVSCYCLLRQNIKHGDGALQALPPATFHNELTRLTARCRLGQIQLLQCSRTTYRNAERGGVSQR